jgi:threonine 3-dehydrogenase
MRAVRKMEAVPGGQLVDVPVPEPGPGQVRIRVAYASICGTDVHIWQWNDWARGRVRRLPLTLGHECAGTVEALGSHVEGIEVGQRVAVETHLPCGRCLPCRTGKAHVCTRVEILGVDRDGVFADYVVVPAANVWPLPPGLPFEIASLLEPFGNSVHTALTWPLTAQTVLVTGLGPTGLGSAAVARAAGASLVVGLDPVEERRALALRMGAHQVADPFDPQVGEILASLAGPDGFDVCLETSGSGQAWSLALDALRHGGSMALLGLPSDPVALDWSERVILRGISLQGVAGRRLWDTWYAATRLVVGGLVDLRAMVTHRFPLEDLARAMEVAGSGHGGKVLLEVGGE